MAQDMTNLNNVLDTGYTTAITEASESELDLFLLNLDKKESAQLASNERLDKAQKVLMDKKFKYEIEQAKELGGTKEEIEARLYKLGLKHRAEVVNMAKKMEDSLYKHSSKQTKIQIKEEQKATLERGKELLRQQHAEKMASNDHIISKAAATRKYNQQVLDINRRQLKMEEDKRNLTFASLKEKRKDGIITSKELGNQFDKISDTYELERQGHQDNIDFINEQIAAQEKLIKEAEENGTAQRGPAIKDAKENIKQLKKQKTEEKAAMKSSDKNRFKDELLANTMKAGFKGMENSLSKMSDAFIKGVDNAIDTVGQFKSGIDARLQGTQSSYDSVAKTLKSSMALSPLAKQTDVLNKLNDAVNKGIAYNVEQRAFLATMTDKIVATFDAFDANLLRIIRLQQADTTAARMGMEANLLQFFNSTFSDNSYLTDGYDRVSEALVDANAQMTRDMSMSFEYNVQKWLGSLSSLGFGTDTITKIATGINYLGSGNVSALAGDTQLQSLLAMSASRAGISYSELLVKGIDDSSVNTLLESMVEYLKEIAEDDNAVVKAAYGDVFNFTQADLRAIKNLTASDISNISGQSMSYSKAMTEIQSQLNQVGDRLSMTEMIDNVFDNFLYSAGESLASNPVTALMWKTLTTIEDVTGGIEIPFVNAAGFGLNLNMSMESLLKTGMFGLSAISQVGNMATSLMSDGGADLGAWGGTEYTKRGGTFSSTVGGVQSTKSGSKAVTSGASSDIKKSAVSSTEEDQESQKKKSKESMAEEITIENLYKEMFDKKTPVYVLDVPTHNKLVDITTATLGVKSKVSDIYTLMSDGEKSVRVTVTNIADTPTSSFPSSIEVSKIGSTTVASLASEIAKGVLGKAGREGDSEGVYSLSDLVNILLYGTISVSDTMTREQLTELNKNLI